MKTIFVTIGEIIAVRNILRTNFWSEFIKSLEETRVIFLCISEKKDEYEKEFSSGNVILELVQKNKIFLKEKIISFLARNGFHSITNIYWHHRSFLNNETKIPPFLKTAFGFLVGNSRLFKKIVRSLELKIETSKQLSLLFDKYNPSLVFSTIVNNDVIDVQVLREAKKRCIQTVGLIRSWDNITSFGFLRCLPDKFLVQNQYIREKLISMQAVNEKNIEQPIGLPHYDIYKDPKVIKDRNVFLSETGLDKQKKVILYAAAGDFLFPQEKDIAEMLNDFVSSGKLGEVQILFRPHPVFSSSLKEIKNFTHVIIDETARYSSGLVSNWEMDKDKMEHLTNVLFYSDLVITAGSTMMIDAAAFDKPIITINFDGLDSDVSFWLSIARFHDHMIHIKDLLSSGGVKVADNQDQLLDYAKQYLDNPEIDKEGRVVIRKRFIEPFDGDAGLRLAKQIKHFLV